MNYTVSRAALGHQLLGRGQFHSFHGAHHEHACDTIMRLLVEVDIAATS